MRMFHVGPLWNFGAISSVWTLNTQRAAKASGVTSKGSRPALRERAQPSRTCELGSDLALESSYGASHRI